MKRVPVLLLAALAVGAGAAAESTDRDQPIYLEAERVELDDVKGISTYTGAVKITQGDMQLRGDKVTVHSKDREPARYVASGAPAEFRHRPKTREEDIVATARELDYEVQSEVLRLRGNARLVQGGDRFEGDSMTYDAARSQVTAAGGTGGRIRMVIQPGRLKKDTPASTPKPPPAGGQSP